MLEKFSLKDKKALVVGGAGTLGFAIAKGLVEGGASVVIGDMVDRLSPERVAEIEKIATLLPVDVTDEESVKSLMSKTQEAVDRIDILINAQGVNYKALVEDIDIEKWDFVHQVNIRGVVLTCKSVVPYMKAQQYGRIISLSSVRGQRGDKIGNATYGASKGAVDILTKNLALELAAQGITVNAIGPSVVPVAMMGRKTPPDHFDEMIKRHPIGRLCGTDDCAALVAFLASDAASYITGHTLYLDGGAMAFL